MPILMKRLDGTQTPYKNSEYIPAYLFLPAAILDRCPQELQLPRTVRSYFHDRNVISTVESDLFIELIIDGYAYVAPSKQTLGEWLDVWLDTYVAHSVKPYTEDSYRSTCKIHIKPVLGDIRLTSLTTFQIQRLYNRLLEKGVSPKTIKNINGVLHKALNQAVRVGAIKNNPTEACDLPKVH